MTYLPAGTAEERLYSFEEGILPEPPADTHRAIVNADGTRGRLVPVPNTHVALAGLISDFLIADSRRLCIFSHPLAESSDPWVLRSRLRLATFRRDVYPLVTPPEVTEHNDLAVIIRHATSLWWSAALTRTPLEFEVTSDRVELAEESLRELATHAEHVIVEAYDNEGFLVWSKRQN